MKRSNGWTIYGVYQECLLRVKSERNDYRDDCIIDQFETGKRITAERDEARKEVERLQKIIRNLTYTNELLDSREHPNVIMPGLGAYLQGINPLRWSKQEATDLLH